MDDRELGVWRIHSIRLLEFELWRERYPGGLTQTEDSFARAMAEYAGRRRRRRRLAVTAGFVILAGVAGAIAVSRQQAVDAAQRAEASVVSQALGASGDVVVTGDHEGIVRVGRVTGGEPHLLVGHEGPVQYVAISPDLRWVATTGEDDTLRLWPMPDLSQPPLHTLPHAELLAKLRSLTNLKVVRDAETPDGWKVELGPFPGWREVPSWLTPASVPGTQEGE